MRQITVPPAVAVAVLVLVAGCGGGQGRPEERSTPSTAVATTTTIPAGATTDAAAGSATVARTTAELDVYAAPGDATPGLTLPATTGFGSPRALLVDTAVSAAAPEGWLPVLLPTRPTAPRAGSGTTRSSCTPSTTPWSSTSGHR